MLVVLLVAGITILGRVLVVDVLADRFVAFLALRILVLAQQREVGLVVVEQRLLPIDFAVTGLALLTQRALVLVVLLVTGNTFGLQLVLVQVAVVAVVALRGLVFAAQRVIGVAVVIKDDLFPLDFIVAVRALGTIASFVLVILLMAVVAGRRRVAKFFLRVMTGFAFGLGVRALEFPARGLVIELLLVQRNDIRVPPLVIPMAGAASRGFHVAVQTTRGLHVLGDVLVAFQTQLVLCLLVKLLMAVAAVLLRFLVRAHHVARSEHTLEHRARAQHRRGQRRNQDHGLHAAANSCQRVQR